MIIQSTFAFAEKSYLSGKVIGIRGNSIRLQVNDQVVQLPKKFVDEKTYIRENQFIAVRMDQDEINSLTVENQKISKKELKQKEVVNTRGLSNEN